MSDLDEMLSAIPGAKPSAAPAASSGMSDFEHTIATLGEGALHALPSAIGFVGDVLNDAPAIVTNGAVPTTVTGGPAKLPGFGAVSQAVNKSFSAAENDYTKGQTPTPKNEFEETVNALGQGLGGGLLFAPAAPEGMAGRAIASGVTSAAAGYATQKAGGNELEQTLASLAGGAVPFARAPVHAEAVHPEFEQGFQAILKNEGGGTLEAPKTNLTSGAYGPAQVMPETLLNPGHGIKPWNGSVEDSVRVGKDLYGAFLKKYDGDMSKALAAYDWGDGHLDHAIEKYGDSWLDHAPEETQKYVNNGMQHIYGGNPMMGGSTGGDVASMAPDDLDSAFDKQIINEIGEKPEEEPTSSDIPINAVALSNLIDSHLGEAHSIIQDLHDTGETDITPEEADRYNQGAREILQSLPDNHPLYYKAQKAVDLWNQIQGEMAEEGTGNKEAIDELTPRGSDKFLGQEPFEVEPANENTPTDEPISQEPPSDNEGGGPPSGGRGGGTGMGGDFGGGEEPPSDEPEGEKYADSVNLNRIKISQDAKQLIKDQLLPANTDIETHEENKVKAMSYIDRHGADNILSGFHKVAPDELSAYQTAVRALSAAGKQNVVDLAKSFPDEDNRTPAQTATLKNAIEMSGRATTLDNAIAKQLGRSMSARRIYMGGNSELSKLLNGTSLDDASLNKLVDKINAMPEQAGDIAADAMKPGWLEYVKSAYYGISLLSRLSTPIGIFASVSVSHLTEALVHSVSALATMPMEPRAMVSWERGWLKGFNDLPANLKQAWRQGIPTDKASLIQSRVNLPGPLGFPSKLIASTDEFFGTLGRSAKAYSDAAQRAYNEGFRGDKFTARVNELVKNATPAEQKIIEDYGKFARLQDAPTPLGRLFKAAVNNKNPIIALPATIVLPFVNIADRLFMYSVRMTPGLSFTDRLTRQDFAQSPTGKAVAISRQLVGAGLASYAVSQVLNGNITGQGPGDPAKKAQWLANHQGDSIKINGKWVSYDRLPFSSLLSAAATATERYQETGNGKDYMKTIEGMFIGAGAGLLHSHYLEGVANFADTMSSGSSDKLADFVGRSVRSFIPGIEQSVNEAVVDPTVRDTKGNPLLDNIKAGLVGESQTLPAKHDVYGRTEHYEGGASRLVNPFPTRTISNDQTINTLDAVNASTSKSVVTPAAKNIHLNGQAVKLSEQGYQKYQALSGQLFRQAMAGNNLSGMSAEDKMKFVKETMRNARAQAKAQLWGV